MENVRIIVGNKEEEIVLEKISKAPLRKLDKEMEKNVHSMLLRSSGKAESKEERYLPTFIKNSKRGLRSMLELLYEARCFICGIPSSIGYRESLQETIRFALEERRESLDREWTSQCLLEEEETTAALFDVVDIPLSPSKKEEEASNSRISRFISQPMRFFHYLKDAIMQFDG